MQDVWDRYKDSTHVNFIASGSVYTLMHRIFMEYKEPLYGRCDSMIKLKPFTTSVLKQVLADYPTYSGLTLERYFREQLREKQIYKNIGSWWETSKGKDADQNEIEIVAISADAPIVYIAEVKRQHKNFKPELFHQKVEAIRAKLFFKYEIETACLTLEEM